MQTSGSRRRARAVVLGFFGACVALACAHDAKPRGEAARKPAAVEHVKGQSHSTSFASCGGGSQGAVPALAFRWPVNGTVTSRFAGPGRRSHRGIDISARHGTLVRAAAAGRVVFSDRKRGYGRVVILEHAGGYETVYAHNQENLVYRGVHVEQGQVIAEVGTTGNATGPHLHFEIRVANRATDPLGCLPIRTTRRP